MPTMQMQTSVNAKQSSFRLLDGDRVHFMLTPYATVISTEKTCHAQLSVAEITNSL